ncbi:uncharacterized protein PAC_09238 [Phialocephala subalpina]|uniref:F-box domain-containing protein n=1 Tax=Phialocephala subalpina TaxID=576137 RepID=A0A1L7X2V9_9HELO|nr:uncharacterized protein PAC_09238 [Phialocephala subalpina]
MNSSIYTESNKAQSTVVAHRKPQDKVSKSNTTQTTTLCTLTPEVHLLIFDHLNFADSTLLGLTNKNFYKIHRGKHGKVPLTSKSESIGSLPLYEILRYWFPNLEFYVHLKKYVTEERMLELLMDSIRSRGASPLYERKKMPPSSESSSRLLKLERFASLPSDDDGRREPSSTERATSKILQRSKDVENDCDIAKVDHDRISKLPMELKMSIANHLDDVSATCLRLTCTNFYEAYRGFLPRVLPWNRSWFGPNLKVKLNWYTACEPYRQLGDLLQSDAFFGELVCFNGGLTTGAKFVTKKRLMGIRAAEAAEVKRLDIRRLPWDPASRR